MQTLMTHVKKQLNNDSLKTSLVSPSLNSNVEHGFRQIQLPETKMGIGSTEGDLIVIVKKCLEIFGLVFFVWLLGERTQFLLGHKMLEEINRNEEQYTKACLDELPSWVFFPDVERAEWINRIIKQVWPYAHQYIDQAVFHDILVPLIRGTSSALADFSFQKLDFGEIPPRIGGIKVYTDNLHDQIMMDIEVFYAGDAIIKTKLKGIACGIKDIQFVGDIRIILSPLINTIPLVGSVTYFFLRKPSINFKLTDAGTLVDLPGLNDLLLVQINDIIASMMVLPNRQVLSLVDDIPIRYVGWSNPQGVVRVFILRAQDLIDADIGGKSDPYVNVKVPGNIKYRTKTINNTTNPEWNEVFDFVVEQYTNDSIQFEVYDKDSLKDDFIGRAQFRLNALVDNDDINTWLTLQDVKKGSLNIRLQYFSLTKQKSALEIMERKNIVAIKRGKLSKALLVCFIDQCFNLPRSKRMRREPNPFCRVTVEGTEDKTQTFENRTNPQFQHLSQILCANPLHEKLRIDVCDARSNNEVIAYFEMPIKQIYDIDTMTIDNQSFSLKILSESLEKTSIILRLSLFILSPGHSTDSHLSSSPEIPSATSSTSITDTNPNNMQDSLTRTSLEEDNVSKRITSGLQLHSSTIHHPTLESRIKADRKSLIIANDPDLRSTNFGIVKIGIRYFTHRSALSVTVHACKGLMNVHRQNLPVPYVRLYLMPDFKKEKKKTKSIHDTLNPTYNDLFEWQASLVVIRQQRLCLIVKNNSPLFAKEQTYMGDLQIDLSNLEPEKQSIAWYALQEPNTSSGGIIKIKYDTLESNE
ncbi:unnamed protein product [Rotaria sp. Silwood1]|nr:unnamed protein product [Rotaria sp. Silwood1]CAF4764856.1 unnamed protein product [Rotaria sp. Silwood1]